MRCSSVMSATIFWLIWTTFWHIFTIFLLVCAFFLLIWTIFFDHLNYFLACLNYFWLVWNNFCSFKLFFGYKFIWAQKLLGFNVAMLPEEGGGQDLIDLCVPDYFMSFLLLPRGRVGLGQWLFYRMLFFS